MVSVFEVQIAVLVLVGLAYALFDVLNKRNVPDIFVYLTVLIGIGGAFAFNYGNLILDFSLAAVVGAVGYMFYRAGLLGGGDVAEFVFISLLMPMQKEGLYFGAYQFPVPFIISVLIAAVFAALIYIPAYYLGIKGRRLGLTAPSARNKRAAALMAFSYALFFAILDFVFGLNAWGAAFVVVLGAASSLILLFEDSIYRGMVALIYPKNLEVGDMIAVNLMSSRDKAYFRRISGFGRLATAKLVSQIKGVRKKIPVYRDSVPFALFVFVGIIASVAFGNILLMALGI